MRGKIQVHESWLEFVLGRPTDLVTAKQKRSNLKDWSLKSSFSSFSINQILKYEIILDFVKSDWL